MKTLRQFLLKKFPTNKYIDCPVSKEMQELMEEYANEQALNYIVSTKSLTEHLSQEERNEYFEILINKLTEKINLKQTT